MSKLIFTNVRTFVAGGDLSGDTNKVEIAANRESKEVTNFLSGGWKEHIAGLGSATINLEGFWEAGAPGLPDDLSWAALGVANPYTVCPVNAADQAVAYLTNAFEFDYTLLGSVGDVAPFKSTNTSTWPLVRGVVGLPPAVPVTANGSGTINNLGAVAANQNAYAAVHVLSVAGSGSPAVTFTLQSAATVGFASPTTRATFTAASAVGGQILRVPGPITDAYWRLAWTVAGSPSFLVAASMGIG